MKLSWQIVHQTHSKREMLQAISQQIIHSLCLTLNDIELFGHWHFLEKVIKDYDKNEIKLVHCPSDEADCHSEN